LRAIVKEKPGEVLAIDGLSTDGTLDILTRYGVRVITDTRGSIGYARKLGVENSRDNFVMFVDSDVELAPGCIRELRLDLVRYGWAGVHCNLQSVENASYWQRCEDAKFRRKYGRPGPTHYIDTIAAMFRRKDLLKHPFDPSLEESTEDIDLCQRLVSDNRLLGISRAVAYHRHRRDFSGFARQRFNYGLGTARIGLKYRSITILLDPVAAAVSESIRAVATRRLEMVPFWLVGGVIKFLGVIFGITGAHRFSKTYRERR
jgi:glycosyltransferase involved in cell wall biosynthesis